jgi:thiosulfate dehydrogenase
VASTNRRAEKGAEQYTIARLVLGWPGQQNLEPDKSSHVRQIDAGEYWIMLKAFVVGILIGVLLVAAGAWFYFTNGWAPVAVADPPLLFEKKLAHGALNARIGKDPHADPPPVPVNETTYMAGADVYKQNCAVCHGLPGESQSNIAKGMFPKPPELFHGTGVTDDPAWETYWKANNGIRLTGMPAFKGTLNDTQIWQVSVLLANADKISPAVKAALASTSLPPPSAPLTAPPAKK